MQDKPSRLSATKPLRSEASDAQKSFIERYGNRAPRRGAERLKPVAIWPGWAEAGLRSLAQKAWEAASVKHRHSGNLGSALRKFVSLVAPELSRHARPISAMKQFVLCPLFENRAQWHPSTEEMVQSVMRSAEYANFMEMVSRACPPAATTTIKGLKPIARAARRARDKRKVEIRAIKSQHPEWSKVQICEEMDRRMRRKKGTGPLPSWKDRNGIPLRSWKGCYDEKTANVKRYISKA